MTVDEGFDLDGDGYSRCQNDCDDSNFFINPSAREQCDLADNDCDERIDEGCGLGEPEVSTFPRVFTLDDDFDEGLLFNVNHDTPTHDQLQLNEVARPLPYVNIANSGRGSAVRINVNNGAILGEYWTAPNGFGRNPSRTTVDLFGNVWVGNRDETGGGKGSVAKIGLVVGGMRVNADGTPNPSGGYVRGPFLYNTCRDRNRDGLIRTSQGLGDILPWINRTDGSGGSPAFVEDADDECILCYQRTEAERTRHVSIDRNNNVWVGGHLPSDHAFDLLEGETGTILANFNHNVGGYGGLVDGNGVLWSAHRDFDPGVLRYDTKNTLTTSDDTWSHIRIPDAYGIGVDSLGNVWVSQFERRQITKLTPQGTISPGFPKNSGGNLSRGVAVTLNDNNVWVANTASHSVSRLDADGNIRKIIDLRPNGGGPSGVAVDANGKVWVTNLDTNNAMRIDPRGGSDQLGVVDLTVDLGSGAYPYNYSDMTGNVALRSTSSQGTWTVVCNSGARGLEWGIVSWHDLVPDGTDVRVDVRAADALVDLATVPYREVGNGEQFQGVFGQFFDVRVTLSRPPGLRVSPVLYDLTVAPLNEAPDCTAAAPSLTELWPPNHRFGFVPVAIRGITDSDGDSVTVTVLGVSSDEVVDDGGDGRTCPDAIIDGSQAQLRAERSGLGDGRVYTIRFRADDGRGGACVDSVTVCVPHDQGSPAHCIESALVVDATSCSAGRQSRAQASIGSPALYQPRPNPFRQLTRMAYEVTNPLGEDVQVSVFDVAGRRIQRLVSGSHRPGRYDAVWDGTSENGTKLGAGIYFIRVNQAGKQPRIARVIHLR